MIGDPSNAIECLRRAIHYAPDRSADVGFVGLANVLHRVDYLNEAVIAVRAALDIHKESVSQLHVHSSLFDYRFGVIHSVCEQIYKITDSMI